MLLPASGLIIMDPAREQFPALQIHSSILIDLHPRIVCHGPRHSWPRGVCPRGMEETDGFGEGPRPLSDSFLVIDYDFISNTALRRAYSDINGTIRISKILSDMDAIAGGVAFKHCHSGFRQAISSYPLSPPSSDFIGFVPVLMNQFSGESHNRIIVTASIDHIKFLRQPSIDSVLRYYGMVTYTGRTSLEVTIQLVQLTPDAKILIALACFTMVARDPVAKQSILVPPLQPRSKEELECFEISKNHRSNRLQVAELPPSNHQVFSPLVMTSTHFCHPQKQNVYGYVFGGYIVHIAYELCFTNATRFSRQIPIFWSIGEVTFKHPVPIGSMLVLESRIILVEDDLIHVIADAQLLEISDTAKTLSNTFHFIFRASGSLPQIPYKDPQEEALRAVCRERRKRLSNDSSFSTWASLVSVLIRDNTDR